MPSTQRQGATAYEKNNCGGVSMKWSVADYAENASYVSRYGEGVLLLLDPQPNEHILDLGCGDGELAEKISSYGCTVIGVDSSEDMIAAARKRGVDAFTISGEGIGYHNEFHAVFSNAALHWMKSPDTVIANVYAALKTGGRFCAEMGGSGNVQTIIAQIYKQLNVVGLNGDHYNPWFFPSKDEYAKHLVRAGFHVELIEQFERPTTLPTDIVGWLKTFAKPFLRDVPEAQHESFIKAVKDGVSDTLKNEHGECFADYVRLRFLAIKKARMVTPPK